MKRITVNLLATTRRAPAELTDWPAYATSTSGLVACRAPLLIGATCRGPSRDWWLVHRESGLPVSVRTLATLRACMFLAAELGKLADWTRPANTIARNRELFRASQAAYDAAGT